MIDRAGGVPAYRQVADILRGRVGTGEYRAAAQIPSERDLVEEFGVSRPTIRQAIDVLRNEGVIVSEHGRGMFVRSSPLVQRLARNRLSRQARGRDQGAFLGDAADGGWTPSVSVTVRFEPADQRIAAILRIAVGAEVCVRDRLMSADGLPVQLAVSRLPREITRGTAVENVETGPGGAYARLEDAGYRLTEFEETVGARMPTTDERTLLRLAPGTPVITVVRVAHSTDRPVEVNDMLLSADRYQLHYHLPADDPVNLAEEVV